MTVPSLRRRLLALWVTSALGFGALLAWAGSRETPLDDPDPAYQRPGFLDADDLPAPAPPLDGRLPRAGRPSVVFFVMANNAGGLCTSLERTTLGDVADLAVVIPMATSADCPAAVLVTDEDGEVADGFKLRMPRGGGPPVGYAVVDAQQRIRYATLDPAVARQLDEVRTIVDAAG